MDRPLTRRARRRSGIAVATAVAAAVATVPAALPAAAARSSEYTTNCPLPENLVRGTAWHVHSLGAGVTLTEGQHSDSRGYVRMHLVSVNMTTRGLSFHPLVHGLSERLPLTELAAGHPTLVAATNTGFFDFRFGAPLGPLVSNGAAITASHSKQMVVGFTKTHRVQAGRLWLSATVTAGGSTRALAGFNTLVPPPGLSAYSSRWGEGELFLPRDATSRYVSNGVVASKVGRYSYPPSSGYLLVARGSAARGWLGSLKHGLSVSVSRAVKTDARTPFQQAYSVSTHLVLPGGVKRTGMSCRRRYPMPARLAIGWANGGRRLLLLQVEDKPGTALHGLDSNQMSRVLVDLGAKDAWAFDGSGSAEVLARLRSQPSRLSMRTYPADGQERPMPVGLGVFLG